MRSVIASRYYELSKLFESRPMPLNDEEAVSASISKMKMDFKVIVYISIIEFMRAINDHKKIEKFIFQLELHKDEKHQRKGRPVIISRKR